MARATSSPTSSLPDPSEGPGLPSTPAPGTGVWRHRRGTLSLDRPRIMGILNLTPDSFSDGGELGSVSEALARAEEMVEAGADLLDVGGESTRPGAPTVPADEERARVVPFLREAVRRISLPFSIDTRKAEVARAALDEGVDVVNDVSGLRFDPAMASVVADARAGVVLMHMRGGPETMRERTHYEDLLSEVVGELGDSVDRARKAGIDDDRVVVDPGIGFAKTGAQSLLLLRSLDHFSRLGFPVLVGPSRKSFLGEILGTPPGERLEGTLASCVIAYLRGARIFRVHDVGPVARALEVARAVEEAGEQAGEEEAGGPRRGGGGVQEREGRTGK